MTSERVSLLQRHWPALSVTSFVVLLFNVWAYDLYLTWQATPPRGKAVTTPLPPKPPTKPDNNTGCIIIDGVSICDKPPLGFKSICGLTGNSIHHAHNIKPPRKEAAKALEWMTEQAGVSNNFRLVAGDFSKKTIAFATVYDNQRYIVYDIKENFLSPKNTLYWRSLGVLAHELGHHLAGHTFVHNQSSHDRELEADKYAGFILAKLGADLDQAIRWTDILNKQGSSTHPPRAKRTLAARKGWLQARRLMHK